MWQFLATRRLRKATPSARVVVQSIVVALGLFLLTPALAGLAGLAPAGEAEAAPALRAGGPDDFGYTFKDSNEPGGPVYAWEEIAGSGTLVTGWNNYNNGFAGPIPIGFGFSFYGTSYDALFVGSNGYLSFGSGFGSVPSSSPLPQPNDPNNTIVVYGGDMHLHNYGSDSAVYYQTLSNPTRLVVQFNRLYWCCWSYDPHTLQVVLYPNGDIEARYSQLSYSNPYAVGIENANGTDGLNYGASLANNLAIRYTYPTGVQLAPPEQERFGKRGAVVTHRLRITNRTGEPDSFDLAVLSGNDWPATLAITQTGVLADGESVFVDVQVTVPLTVAVGDAGQATVEAVSVAQPAVRDTAVLNTTASSDEIAYVALAGSGRVALIDTDRYSVLGVVDVGVVGCQNPWRAAVTPAGDQVYVTCYQSGSVVIIDTSDYHVAAVRSGIPEARDVAFTPDGSYALVTSGSANRVATINTQTLALGAITTAWTTNNIAVHPYLNRAYVTGSGSSTLLVINTTTLNLAPPINLSDQLEDVVASADGRYLFVSHRYGNKMTVIDALSQSVHTVVSGLDPMRGLEVAPNGTAVYGATYYNGVHVIDGVTFEHITTVSTGYGLWSLATTCDGRDLYVGGVSLTVPVIDTSLNQVLRNITMPGYNTAGVAVCPQRVVQDLLLLPAAQVNAGARGQVVSHDLTLVNATGAADSFTLSLGGSTWPAALSTYMVGPLAPGASVAVQVQITIPAGVNWYDSDSVQVTATGVNDPGFSATASLTTVANGPPAMAVAPAALSNVQLVGQTVDQTLAISNGNGVTLTVQISNVDLTPGLVRLAPLDLPRPADVFAATAASPPLLPGAVSPSAPADVPRVLASGHEPSPQIQSGYVYTTTVDNENNALTGSPDGDMDTYVCSYYSIAPIEFNIFVDRVPALAGNVLTVRASDVNSNWYNHPVRLNGVLLGNLASDGSGWSETAFSTPSGLVVPGRNLVQIDIDPNRCITVDWGELFVVSRPAGWLHQSPSSAAVASHSSQDVTVTFDSNGLQPGAYEAIIALESNDPAQSYLPVPVAMTVEPTADMGSVAGAISDAWTGQPLTATVELIGVHTLTPRAAYQLWATAGDFALRVSAPGYVAADFPVTITAGGVTAQDVALEPAQPRLAWAPQSLDMSLQPGNALLSTMVISNTGPMPLDMALFEINLDFSESPPTVEDLTGKRILYDRSHGQPARGEFSTLINEAIAAGAEVVENWYFPIDANVLQGYDILWSNCCGSISWGLSELLAVNAWLRSGGAVLVHGGSSASTSGLASLFDIFYWSDSCAYGTTTNITPHPISAGVSSIYIEGGCQRLSASAGSTIVVFDTLGRPNVVTKEHNGGKMVVLASSLLNNWQIPYADHRVLGNNILGWLARPSYSDVPWLSFNPTSGVVSGHSGLPIDVQSDAAGLLPGIYRARLAIEHNDPNHVFPAEAAMTLVVEVPTAITLNDLATAGQPAPAPLTALPMSALPAAAIAALGLAGWRSRRR
jgi:DNA-binding beta-propeller fold protein YncE